MLKTSNRNIDHVDNVTTQTDTQNRAIADSLVQSDKQQAIPFMFVPPAQTALEAMPADVKNIIFADAAIPVDFQHGLRALAKTSKVLRSSVLEFMRNDENGKAFSAALKIGPAPQWQAQAKLLTLNAKIYRKDFAGSAASVFNNVSMKLTGEMASGALTRFKAIEFNLNKFDYISEVSDQISSIRGKPVKINASGFKGELNTLQSIVMSALSAVDSSCPVILDLSMNGLRDADLRPLLEFMKVKPIIYQLNLDQNPLCSGDQASETLVELCQLSTPISHLYLIKTGLNDATAFAMSEALGKHPCLTHLDLRSNVLTAVGALALIDAVDTEAHGVLNVVRLQNNKFKKAVEIEAAAGGLLSERSMNIVELEDMTIFSPNFSQDELNQQKIRAQAMESQRL